MLCDWTRSLDCNLNPLLGHRMKALKTIAEFFRLEPFGRNTLCAQFRDGVYTVELSEHTNDGIVSHYGDGKTFQAAIKKALTRKY